MAQTPGRDALSSDITIIWHCLRLSDYGQFRSVTYPEITVIWIHL